MFPLFETIAIQDGRILNAAGHQRRYERSLRHCYGDYWAAMAIAEMTIPAEFSRGLIRCRMNYNAFQQSFLFAPYVRREIRSFQPAMADDIDYSYKWTKREMLEQLLSQRGQADEILIVKQQYITDCSIGNLIFLRQGQWFTPDTPLLKGTQRELLLAQDKIQERTIRFNELDYYEDIRLINALNGWETL